MKQVDLVTIPVGELFCLKQDDMTLWRVKGGVPGKTVAVNENSKTKTFNSTTQVWTIK